MNLADEFIKFHTKNPEVYQMFEKFAMNAIHSGKQRFGAKAVMERVRWESMISIKCDLKLNNNYVSFYARIFEDKHPQYKGFFQKRRSVADQKVFLN